MKLREITLYQDGLFYGRSPLSLEADSACRVSYPVSYQDPFYQDRFFPDRFYRVSFYRTVFTGTVFPRPL